MGGREGGVFFGTTHFHTVWEGLIDTIYGIPETEKRDFFPEAKWWFAFNGKTVPVSSIRPDTIMRPDGRDGAVFVLDAKYYSFIKSTGNVPFASDINKQVAYGAYAAEKEKERGKENVSVYNAFLIPYDFVNDPRGLKTNDLWSKGERYYSIGYSFLGTDDSKEPYKRVLGILIDTKWLMQEAGRTDNKRELGKFISDTGIKYNERIINNG